ncbi:hypothetical protein [Actinokineospora sp.]|uniref:hypothetical protein n=1 Tax=Actinokineospora sp. TaxID=1872133 RepID=UPI003D6BAE37
MVKDPIAHWMEQGCRQPSSLPNTDYRSLRTFGGHTFRKPAQDSDNKRRHSAHWFGLHHRGGDMMPHHRTLNPVVIRDWSRKMEQFASALEISANTTTKPPEWRGIKEFNTWSSSEWVSPEPALSPYLTTAVEPVNWPQRPGPCPPTAARPMLSHEQRISAERCRTPAQLSTCGERDG